MAFAVRFRVIRLEKSSNTLTTVGNYANQAAEAFSYRLDTYAQGILSGGTNDIQFDANATATSGNLSETMTWAGVWIKNSSAAFGGSATLTVYSDDNSGFSSPTSRGSALLSTLSATQHVLVLNSFSSTTERYWRFRFTNMSVAPQVAMVMLGTLYDIESRWNWGSTPAGNATADSVRHGITHFNDTVELQSGEKLVTTLRSQGAEKITRTWELINKTDYDNIVAAFDACRGSFTPFLMVQDDYQSSGRQRLMRFSVDSLDGLTAEPAYQLYNVTLPMEQLPFINDGEAY